MFIRSGRVLFMEFKAPGKRPTLLQLRWLINLADHGMTVAWCDDIANGKAYIDRTFI